MREVSGDGASVVDIWPYVKRLDTQSLEVGRVNDVAYVYEDSNGRFHHVLLATDRHNIFVAIIVDLSILAIVGHHLLDMNRLYGLTP